ncbi:cystatin-A/B [Mytilus galloprovincialis]|uniref:Cystatin-A/B n=1 Tax=Mytilus galloprovincialis TaxID=29158 RepID=A0A8B6C6U7_MYTGA|nr:cystatin-A/B [Mytilus galloprovincialis]
MTKLVILLCLSVFAVAVEAIRPGGLSDVMQPNEEVNRIVADLKGEIEAQLGEKLNTYKVVSFKRQVVAGTNYFIKIEYGLKYVHIRVSKSLGGRVTLASVESGHKLHDLIKYFE